MERPLLSAPDMVFVHIGDLKAVFTGKNLFSPKSEAVSESHFHLDFEFQYVIAGTVSLIFAETHTLSLKAKECALISPSFSHRSEGVQPVSRLSFNFSLCRVESEDKYSRFSEFDYYRTLLRRVSGVATFSDSHISQCIEAILSLDGQPKQIHRVRIAFAALLCRLGFLLDSQPAVLAAAIPEADNLSDEAARRRWKIESFISAYYADPEPLSLLAAMMNLSVRQTARCVLSITGHPIGQLIFRQRMEAAKRLLLTTSLDCAEIASRVGYESYPGFFSAFRRFYGLPPSAFRDMAQ